MAGFNINDVSLNKSGTVGTEPIGKPDGRGGINKFTELKFGSLGAVDIPTGHDNPDGRSVLSAIDAGHSRAAGHAAANATPGVMTEPVVGGASAPYTGSTNNSKIA